MVLGRWGAASEAMHLSETMQGLLSQALGVRGPGHPVPELAELRLPDPRLPEEIRERLAAVVGPSHARDDHEARVRHTRGKSLIDLLRLRASDMVDAPDLVLLPGSHDEV